MSTFITTHRRHHLGPTTGSALAAAAVVGAVVALSVALSQPGSTQPVDPTNQCTITSCHAGDHPVLPGRHAFHATTGGGQSQLGQP
jgi:hypothetical protein